MSRVRIRARFNVDLFLFFFFVKGKRSNYSGHFSSTFCSKILSQTADGVCQLVDCFLMSLKRHCMCGSRNFHRGGGGRGGLGPTDRKKKVLTTLYFSPQLILQRGPMVYFKDNFSRFQRSIFSRGGPIANSYMETQGTVIFQGGVQTPTPSVGSTLAVVHKT